MEVGAPDIAEGAEVRGTVAATVAAVGVVSAADAVTLASWLELSLMYLFDH